MNALVEILLSTFNGEKYLKTQLDSIIQQDYTNWKLLVRDDGSVDKTASILNDYAQKHPGKIKLLNDAEGNLGYSGSFSKLLKYSSADYVMYCDQDDYWYPGKISTMLSFMLVEEKGQSAMAHIVFSDLEVTDSELKIISNSFLQKTGYSARMGVQIFFLKNYVPGCNVLFNRILIQQALKTDNIINLHDHWLMMVCCSVGKVSFIDKVLMKYRIHDKNAIGFLEERTGFLKRFLLFFKNILKYGISNKKYRNLLYLKNIEQMKNICVSLKSDVSKDAMSFAGIDNSNYISRKIRNVLRPYRVEKSLLKQLAYVICF